MCRVLHRISPIATILLLCEILFLGPGFLQAEGFPARFDLSTLDGTNGFVLRGRAAFDETGKSVSCAGDINGDGIEDLLVGAPPASRDSRRWVGESYLVFGTDRGFPALLELDSLDGSNGVILKSRVFEGFSGMSVSGAGDVNGDGIDDLLVGAGIASPNFIIEAGLTYVVFGSRAGFPATLDLVDMDGTQGLLILGLTIPERMGTSVSSAGDLNGDNIDDYLLGALGAAPDGKEFAGVTYVVYGSPTTEAPDLAQLDGDNGFILKGTLAGDFTGNSVSNAGDVNGDGWPDMIIGAQRAARFGLASVGESFVVFGGQHLPPAFDLFQLDGENGFVIRGVAAGDFAGTSVSGAGDINGDGLADVLVGAPLADRSGRLDAGEAYLLFGTNQGFASAIEPSQLNGSDGIVLTGPQSSMELGNSVARAGDVNGDGLDDFVLGAPRASPGGRSQAGAVYVVFGSKEPFDAHFDLTQLDGSNGFVVEGLNARDLCGWSVSTAGDVNGDGVDDLLLGAPSASPGDQLRLGEAYVIFGKRTRVAVSLAEFGAEVSASGVHVRWRFRGDPRGEVAAVHVQRALQAHGPYENRNSTPLPPAASMQFVDAIEQSAQEDVLWYRVLLVLAGGELRPLQSLAVDQRSDAGVTGLEAPRDSGDADLTLVYRIARHPTAVRLDLFDVRGRLVRTFDQGIRRPGRHLVQWDRRSGSGSRVGSGIYLLRLRTEGVVDARKVVLENG